MTVLVIAPHPDDEAIGCGGTIKLHADRGDRVVVAFLTSGELALRHLDLAAARAVRETEAAAAAELLGIARLEFCRGRDWFLNEQPEPVIRSLSVLLRDEQPSLIIAPHCDDGHPDHRVAVKLFREAADAVRLPPVTMLTYEVWSPLPKYNQLVNISEVADMKWKAVRCFKSQLVAFRYDQAIRGLNRYRGIMHAGWKFAEAFHDTARPDDEVSVGPVNVGFAGVA